MPRLFCRILTLHIQMACSIEVRVPFLDNEVVEFLRRVPAKLKIHGHIQQYLLRKAMDDILPKEVLRRRKAAFGLPIRGWLRNKLREMLTDNQIEFVAVDYSMHQP